MSVKGKRKKTKSDKKPYKPKTPKKSLKQYLMIGFVMLATIAFIFSSLPSGMFGPSTKTNTGTANTNTSTSSSTSSSSSTPSEPQFTEEGSLKFLKAADNSEIRAIKIEVADNELERGRGMMFRKSIPNDTGMLFIMDQLKEQAFYMRNTYVSLDILFIDDQYKVVSIAKKTVPLTDTSIPSNGKAKYVLEVAAGYTDAYGIGVGDVVEFEIK